jgi:hypothetical protein
VNINKDSNANQFDNIKFQGQINLNSNIWKWIELENK